MINDLQIKNNTDIIQIDHLIISNFGVFVIETKNLSGIIYNS
ncbi:MAG: nuclease-related domain-containing protein [Actinomycetota bacterium]|nr:nuclease-related domain-containing protein [Actinomycetota bacterium]